MILKVEDALKPFSRTDPDCSRSDAFGRSTSGSLGNIPRSLSQRDPLRGCDMKIIYRFIPRQLCCEVVNFK